MIVILLVIEFIIFKHIDIIIQVLIKFEYLYTQFR